MQLPRTALRYAPAAPGDGTMSKRGIALLLAVCAWCGASAVRAEDDWRAAWAEERHAVADAGARARDRRSGPGCRGARGPDRAARAAADRVRRRRVEAPRRLAGRGRARARCGRHRGAARDRAHARTHPRRARRDRRRQGAARRPRQCRARRPCTGRVAARAEPAPGAALAGRAGARRARAGADAGHGGTGTARAAAPRLAPDRALLRAARAGARAAGDRQL